ncbi:peptidoglycan-binding domain-containing protein [Paraoerskovia sediminicola]
MPSPRPAVHRLRGPVDRHAQGRLTSRPGRPRAAAGTGVPGGFRRTTSRGGRRTLPTSETDRRSVTTRSEERAMNVEPWSTIGPGSSGVVVQGIQHHLRARGGTLAADGSYGPITAAAVTTFQSSAGLTADGVVGPATWPNLVVPARIGDTGEAVRAVQEFGLVPSPGVPPLVVDGSYGPITRDRVRFFQESWGLQLDGAAGRETWSFLSTSVPGPRPWPLVKPGAQQATNWRVLAAQHLLRHHGASIVADGSFGPLSTEAARQFQQDLRARFVSGTIGQLDWPELIVTVRQGDHGEAVRAAQTLLPGGLTVDGSFGPLTDAAVREFQTMFAPPVDGVVGPITWHTLTLRIFD